MTPAQLTIAAVAALAAAGATRKRGSMARKKPPRRRSVRRPLKGPAAKKKDKLVSRARAIFKSRMGDCSDMQYGMCPIMAWSVIEAGREQGRRLVLQAGSASWRMVPPELDDGVMSTHFSYMWEPHSMATRMAMARGTLPELHVWVADPKTQEIIDITTGDLPRLAKNMIGAEWLDKPPPDYIWSRSPDAIYQPDRDATILVAQMLEAGGYPLRRT